MWQLLFLSFLIPDQIDENLKLALQQDLTSMAPGLVIQVSIATVGASPDEGASPLSRDVLSMQEDQGPRGAAYLGHPHLHLPIRCSFYPSPGCAGDKAQYTWGDPQKLRVDVSILCLSCNHHSLPPPTSSHPRVNWSCAMLLFSSLSICHSPLHCRMEQVCQDSHLGSVTVIESHGEALLSSDAFKGTRGAFFVLHDSCQRR